MPGRPVRRRAELVLSLGVLALGVAAAVVAFGLPEAGGYARIGPNFVPKVVAGGLIVMGLWLLAEVATGGWRDAVDDDASARGEHAFQLPAFAWVSAGLFAQMALIRHGGFVIAAAAMRCLNGHMQGRLVVAKEGQAERMKAMGITDMKRIYTERGDTERMAIFSAMTARLRKLRESGTAVPMQ